MRRPVLAILVLAGLGLASIVAVGVWTAPDRAELLLIAGAELGAGRETALTAGLAAGVPWTRAATVTLGIEWTMLLIGAPLVILGGDWIREQEWTKRHLARAEAYAHAHPQTGIVALCALTLAPFFPVGALTSVLIGEVLGLPQARLVPSLALAELFANVSFAFLASQALGYFPYPRIAAAILASLLLVVVLTLTLWPRRTQTAM